MNKTKNWGTSLAQLPDVEVVRVFAGYPTSDNLLRSIRAQKPDFLFLSMEDFSQVEVLLARLDDMMPGFLVVAFGGQLESPLGCQLRWCSHLCRGRYLNGTSDAVLYSGCSGRTSRAIHGSARLS